MSTIDATPGGDTSDRDAPGVGERVVARIAGRDVDAVVTGPVEFPATIERPELVPVATDGGRWRVPTSNVMPAE